MKKTTAVAIGLATSLVGFTVGSRTLVRDRCPTWGAAPDEVARAMPGDDLLPQPDIVSTRAVTVDVETGTMWPWLSDPAITQRAERRTPSEPTVPTRAEPESHHRP